MAQKGEKLVPIEDLKKTVSPFGRYYRTARKAAENMSQDLLARKIIGLRLRLGPHPVLHKTVWERALIIAYTEVLTRRGEK